MNEETNLITRTRDKREYIPAQLAFLRLPKWLFIPLFSSLLLAALWCSIVQPTLHAASPAQMTETHLILVDPLLSEPVGQNPLLGSVGSTPAVPVTLTHVPAGYSLNDTTHAYASLPPAAAAQGPALVVTKTVGLNPGNCATTSTITVTQGTQVVYCYFVLNTGTITFSLQSVVDSHLGVLLSEYPFILTPQTGNKPAALFTLPSVITQTTTNVVTWTGSSLAGEVALDTDSATVHVVSVDVTKTVGIKSDECADTTAITVTRNTPVYYCYTVENTSATPLVRHMVQDTELGTVFENLEYPLAPGGRFDTVEAGYVITDTDITSRTSTVTWKAFTENGLAPTDKASAAVHVPDLVTYKTVGTKGEGCATNSAISVLVDTEVVYCYMAINTGSVLLTLHTVVDSQQGVLLKDEPFMLAPGATVLFTTTQILTSPTTSQMTWTASAAVQPLGGTAGVVEAESQSGTTVSVIPRANFTAIVFDDLDRNGQQRELEPGLSDAQVTLISSSGDQISDTTDTTGRSSFSGLAPGYYTVTVDVIWPGGSAITTTANVPTRVVLAGGESKSEAFGFNVSDRVLLPLIVQ